MVFVGQFQFDFSLFNGLSERFKETIRDGPDNFGFYIQGNRSKVKGL